MARRPSPQTLAVLRALDADAHWRHGYDIARQTSLAAGSLYPILMRLAERGLVEAEWEPDPPTGRPRRHLYRITGAGTELLAAYPSVTVDQSAEHPTAASNSGHSPVVARKSGRPRPAPRRLRAEGQPAQ